jgi:DNA-directed RNA polymerase I, II, and III subunit RPABC5
MHSSINTLDGMLIPVRCYSCGRVVGNLYEPYKALLNQDYSEGEALDALNLPRYCCRRMILTHVDLIDDMLPYSVPVVGTMQRLNRAGTASPSPGSHVGTPVAMAPTGSGFASPAAGFPSARPSA